MTQNLPLSGVRVVELATVVAAPTVGRIMATYGAEVIKIETPGGDGLRPFGKGHCLPTEDGNSPLFDLYNSGKKFTSLNLKTEQGQEAFHRLLTTADVFLTNVRYKGLERMGLDYETLKVKYPRLVYAHFSGFGLKGVDADRPGYDMTAFWMRSGALLDWLLPDSFPMRPTFAFGDVATASAFLSGIMMGLYSRNNTGKGTMVLGITQEDLMDIMNIRQRVEGLAAYYATKNMTPEGLEKLRQLNDLQDFYYTRKDAERQSQMDDLFHDTIYELSQRTIIRDTLQPLHRKTMRYRKISLEDPSRLGISIQEHKDIFNAMASGNAELAEELTVQHIIHAKNNMITRLKYNG